ncbi:unnamed protein product [Lupinus luteus]|uniref:Uncharacterized protein n=1 Tax=Lupinus luteus TaxID=3873 RepID=A0AAV1XJ82_LUPLU
MDDDDSLEDKDDPNNNNEKQNKSFKSFNLLNALMMLKDLLFLKVCPMFSASLVKKILENFVSDEFYPDLVPTAVFEALESENDFVDGKDYVYVNSFPCIAAPIAYSPPPATFIVSIFAEIESKSQLQRSRSSILRKSYTSDDELDELRSPLSSMLFTSPSMESK